MLTTVIKRAWLPLQEIPPNALVRLISHLTRSVIIFFTNMNLDVEEDDLSNPVVQIDHNFTQVGQTVCNLLKHHFIGKVFNALPKSLQMSLVELSTSLFCTLTSPQIAGLSSSHQVEIPSYITDARNWLLKIWVEGNSATVMDTLSKFTLNRDWKDVLPCLTFLLMTLPTDIKGKIANTVLPTLFQVGCRSTHKSIELNNYLAHRFRKYLLFQI